MQDILLKLKSGTTLSAEEMTHSLKAITNEGTPGEIIGAFLMALSQRGESPDEIAAAAGFLREHAATLQAPDDAVDCCGTGGDVKGTLNISTAVALVCAACGVPVAKHGNRAASSRSGTADVLEALGVPLTVSGERLKTALQELGFAFLMAPAHHQILKPLAPIRKNLGMPTIFNLLGPLANPAGTKLQLIGVFDRKWGPVFAQALHKLGTRRAWIVHGRDGLDEITLTDQTDVTILHEDGRIETRVLSPDDFGLPPCTLDDIRGGEARDNAAALSALLNGEASAYRNVVLANAAAVLVIHQSAASLIEGVEKAANAIDRKRAKNLLEQYIKLAT